MALGPVFKRIRKLLCTRHRPANAGTAIGMQPPTPGAHPSRDSSRFHLRIYRISTTYRDRVESCSPLLRLLVTGSLRVTRPFFSATLLDKLWYLMFISSFWSETIFLLVVRRHFMNLCRILKESRCTDENC